MFGEETKPDSVRPSRPSSSEASTGHPAFFVPDARLNDQERENPDQAEELSLFPELSFDPTATAAYTIDLTDLEPAEVGNEDAVGLELTGRTGLPQPDPDAQTGEGQAGESEHPELSLSDFERSAAWRSSRNYGELRRDGYFYDVDSTMNLPTNDDWQQRSLFSTGDYAGPLLPPIGSIREQGASLSVRSDSLLKDWYLQPLVWLVGGLLVVAVVFLGLLLSDGKGSEPVPAEISTSGDSPTR